MVAVFTGIFLDFSYWWVALVIFGITAITSRSLLEYGDEEEDFYDQLTEEAAKNRQQRLNHVLEKMKEIEKNS
ncbi:hypothetical protein UL82_02825 [Corynebacterium kutscheri]|uniref:Uncharacterized protein n=1 Tax=Corynebacterium kutscheri TaxID=35755 RepID=A0A0F6TD25_9CORY|nr:hypothetical protein [Corynebacterium kutscheri]AKE40789.1 hypothetical protein UL82_02825 [Corynebacterium kutscheri]VEH09086.1 Uncharacterised protein [Corynebacterium kutscheri]